MHVAGIAIQPATTPLTGLADAHPANALAQAAEVVIVLSKVVQSLSIHFEPFHPH